MKRLLVVSGWLIVTPLLLVGSIIFLTQLTPKKVAHSKIAGPEYQSYSALPSEVGSVGQAVVSADSRVTLVENFLESYSSPLAPYAKNLVKTADYYGLDFRLLPAIAMQESNAGHKIPEGTHNAWGFGIYGDQSLGFDSWEKAIETVAEYLKSEYIDKGLITPEQIMVKYTPPSVEKGGPWAKGVEYFMAEME